MISIPTPGAVAPSITLPTTVHHAADNDASPDGWLESLLSSAKKALPAQLALASPRPTASPDPLIVPRILLNRQAPQTCGYVNANICVSLVSSTSRRGQLTNRSLTYHMLRRFDMRVKHYQLGPLLLRRCPGLHHTDHLPRLYGRGWKLRFNLPV